MNKVLLIIVLLVFGIGCQNKNKILDIISFDKINKIDYESKNLFPEDIGFYKKKNLFLISSYANGNIYSYSLDNQEIKKYIEDESLVGATGLFIDNKKNILYVANGDSGVSKKSKKHTINKVCGVLVYDLVKNQKIKYIDFQELYNNADCLANGITMDANHNIYVTDSFRPVIYKIQADSLKASIFVVNDKFKGSIYNLNGIEYDKKGFLLVLQMGTGKIYKIDLNQRYVQEVLINDSFIGADGVIKLDDNYSFIIQAFELKNKSMTEGAFKLLYSKDNYNSAKVEKYFTKNAGNPTNGIVVKDKLYILNSWIGKYQFANKNKDSFSILQIDLKYK